jgi:soluble lytic murein transglycosylase
MSGLIFSRKQLKTIKRALFIILAIYWAFFCCVFFYRSFLRAFVYPTEYKEIVKTHAEVYSLDKNLVFAVIKVESGFKEKSQSGKGAKGLMQITDATADYIAKKIGLGDYDLFTANDNIRLGCYYLRYLLDGFNDLKTALYAYNAGEGRVREWLNNEEYSKDGKTLFTVPYTETREYAEKILKTFSKYEKLY